MNKKILTTAISLLFVSSVGAQRGNTRWTAEGISLNRPVPELRRRLGWRRGLFGWCFHRE